jgi:hypothetical protein
MKRQIFFNPRLVCRIEDRSLRELTLALRTFGCQKVPAASLATQDFPRRSHLKTFCHRFLSFASRYWFWHKEPAI